MREKRVNLKIPAYVRETLTALETAGHQAYCVGGCVRDSLLGRMPEDWDVTTSALPEETMKVFGDRAIPTGLKHGTVTVCCQEGKVETTTFRRDGVYADHRHPEQVTFTPDLTEDLARRDFTVNAMATDLRGMVYDPFDGQADLQEEILRCVGDPERRFSEDALRILRCLRFAAVLGFSIEPETGKALMTCRNLLREMAPERVHEELTKLLCGPWAASVLRRYPDVIGAVLPEILPMVGFDQRNPHHCYDVWEHTLHALDAAGRCCFTIWVSRSASPWTRRASDISWDTAWFPAALPTASWTGCGSTMLPRNGSVSWWSGMITGWRRKGVSAGC